MGEPDACADHSPLLVMVHGWMDVGASFQFGSMRWPAWAARAGWWPRLARLWPHARWRGRLFLVP